MSLGGDSGNCRSSISDPKFSLLTASSLDRLTLGAEERQQRDWNESDFPTHSHLKEEQPVELLWDRGSLLGKAASTCRFLAPRVLPREPGGQDRVAASPPAMASSNVGQASAMGGGEGLEDGRNGAPAEKAAHRRCPEKK